MAEEKYHKSQIATEQLKTAILLFLNDCDPASVITLAGAASAILDQLVKNKGKTPFVDFARHIYAAFGGSTPRRTRYNRYINDKLGINALKHMSPSCPENLEIDLQKNAEDAIGKAVADYVAIFGQEHDFIRAYLQWAWVNRNGPQIMEDYKKFSQKLIRR
jgi:hypothetical protein